MDNVPIIDKDLCISCGACVAACQYDVLALGDDDKPVIVNGHGCNKSGECAEVCPTEAITLPWIDGE